MDLSCRFGGFSELTKHWAFQWQGRVYVLPVWHVLQSDDPIGRLPHACCLYCSTCGLGMFLDGIKVGPDLLNELVIMHDFNHVLDEAERAVGFRVE